MNTIQPLFYVQLVDSFDDTCHVREQTPSFPGMTDPFLEAREHVSSGKVYPVMEVKDDHELTILDDKGYFYEVARDFFKFVDRS